MPRLTRWFVKTALVYFVAGLLAGLAIAARPWLPPAVAALQPAYFHLLMVGWVTQLILGIAFWMFPRHSPRQPRGSERLGWATYGLLNAGLLLRATGEPWVALRPESGAGWLLVVSAALQLAAGWAFVANTWRRVKEH